jgi:hypothetical protein
LLTSACPPAIAYSRVDTGWTPSFLPSTQALDPGATGFYVLEAFLGGQYTLAKEGSPPEGGLIFNVSGGAPPFGTYVLANLVQSDGNTIATANGGGAVRRKRMYFLQQPTGPVRCRTGGGTKPDCRRWLARSDRGGRWPSRLVAAAAEDRLNFRATPRTS